MTAPMLVRWYALAEDGELVSNSFAKALDNLPNLTRWRKAIEGKESVMGIYDKKASVEGMKAKLKSMQATKK